MKISELLSRQRFINLLVMILEKVKSHSYREDIFIDEIVASQNEIKESDKIMVKNILLKEFALYALNA